MSLLEPELWGAGADGAVGAGAGRLEGRELLPRFSVGSGCCTLPSLKPVAMTVTRTWSPRLSSTTVPKMMFASGSTFCATRSAASLIS